MNEFEKELAQIIESASRPIDDLDKRLTMDGFLKWYELLQKEKQT